MIEVKVYRETCGKKGGPTEGAAQDFMARGIMQVPERALKGGDAKSHGTA